MSEQTPKQPITPQDESAAETEGHRVFAEPSDARAEPDTEVEGHRFYSEPSTGVHAGPSHKPEGQE